MEKQLDHRMSQRTSFWIQRQRVKVECFVDKDSEILQKNKRLNRTLGACFAAWDGNVRFQEQFRERQMAKKDFKEIEILGEKDFLED